MKIIVCGAGQVGTSIAKQLSRESNDVTVIEKSLDRINDISNSIDVNAFHGFASHPTILDEAGAEHADMIIAVTGSDEINMVTCQIAHSVFNIPVKIARIRHQNYLQEQWKDVFRHDHLPIDVIISPEVEVARAVNHRLHVPGAIDSVPFADGKVKVVAVRCTTECPLLQIPLYKITERIARINVSIMGIWRNETFFIPKNNDTILEGDEVFFAADTNAVPEAMELFGHEEQEARRILIIGAGNIGLYIAEQLEQEEQDVRVKIIEFDQERAEYVAGKLHHTSVINGNALENEILEEANIAATETAISVTNDDKVNILSSLLAKRFGCERAVTLINRSSYNPLISSLGVDVIVNPREITVSSILQHIRSGRIRNVHAVCNGAAEILEAEAIDSSPIVGKSIENLHLPENSKIGALLRDEQVIIPNESTIIKAGDRIIVLCHADQVKEIEQLFSVKFEYF